MIDSNSIFNASLSAPARHHNLMPTSLHSSPPHANVESAANANMTLHNSKRLQQSVATKAAERIEQIEHLPTEDTPKKKSPLAVFQLTNKDIPDSAGHIKVGSPLHWPVDY